MKTAIAVLALALATTPALARYERPVQATVDWYGYHTIDGLPAAGRPIVIVPPSQQYRTAPPVVSPPEVPVAPPPPQPGAQDNIENLPDPAIAAAQPAPRLATHNGSIMTVASDPVGNVSIVYAEPKAELVAAGVVPGTPLINGRWTAPGVFEGTAVVFAPWCGRTFGYPVRGAQDNAGALVLDGAAPQITQWCGIASYALNANSHLVFWPYQQQAAQR